MTYAAPVRSTITPAIDADNTVDASARLAVANPATHSPAELAMPGRRLVLRQKIIMTTSPAPSA